MDVQTDMLTLEFTINGKPYKLQVKANMTLQDLLRDVLGYTGTKRSCEIGVCGACTILLDGKAVNSCLVLVPKIQKKEITTIEGLAQGQKLHPIQKAFVDHGAIQCGFCTPGMILSSKALLDENPSPSENEIRSGLKGNICRCTGYVKIIEAVRAVAEGSKHRS